MSQNIDRQGGRISEAEVDELCRELSWSLKTIIRFHRAPGTVTLRELSVAAGALEKYALILEKEIAQACVDGYGTKGTA